MRFGRKLHTVVTKVSQIAGLEGLQQDELETTTLFKLAGEGLRLSLRGCEGFMLALPLLVLLYWPGNRVGCNKKDIPVCDSEIYCHGKLLHTVQMARVFPDSKTFVDMKLKASPKEVNDKFEKFMAGVDGKPTVEQLRTFVHENFEDVGQEFESWVPDDWTDNPAFIDRIRDPSYKEWGRKLNALWKVLGRKMKKDVLDNADRYSGIWMPNPFVVPGGRFREYYYWDSYWIIRGLLLSEMYKTAKGMLENFMYLVNKFGFIPNGGRVYYMRRSQIPLLAPMVKIYVETTEDHRFLRENIDTIEKEFKFWYMKHTDTVAVQGLQYELARYWDDTVGPRPEAYYEDVHTAKGLDNEKEIKRVYSDLKAAAESGWVFSSRWSYPRDNLSHIRTSSLYPVELNSILCMNARILSEFNYRMHRGSNALHYSLFNMRRVRTMKTIFWNETVGTWYDFDRNYTGVTWSAGSLAPLWTRCYLRKEKLHLMEKVLKFVRDNELIQPGGAKTTMDKTNGNEIWDFPNVLAPVQHFVIYGLRRAYRYETQRMAFKMAKNWLKSVYMVYNKTGYMYDRYDALTLGVLGGGGEYGVQTGFGWTNGLAIDLLDKYGYILNTKSNAPTARPAATTFAFSLSCAALYVVWRR